MHQGYAAQLIHDSFPFQIPIPIPSQRNGNDGKVPEEISILAEKVECTESTYNLQP